MEDVQTSLPHLELVEKRSCQFLDGKFCLIWHFICLNWSTVSIWEQSLSIVILAPSSPLGQKPGLCEHLLYAKKNICVQEHHIIIKKKNGGGVGWLIEGTGALEVGSLRMDYHLWYFLIEGSINEVDHILITSSSTCKPDSFDFVFNSKDSQSGFKWAPGWASSIHLIHTGVIDIKALPKLLSLVLVIFHTDKELCCLPCYQSNISS